MTDWPKMDVSSFICARGLFVDVDLLISPFAQCPKQEVTVGSLAELKPKFRELARRYDLLGLPRILVSRVILPSWWYPLCQQHLINLAVRSLLASPFF